MTENGRRRAAIKDSIKLVEQGEQAKALELLDESIEEAAQSADTSWVVTLTHHAAILCRHVGDLQTAKRYYDQSLAADPENAMALYGLAYIAREQGETESAQLYAARSYRTIVESNDEMLKQGLLDLVVKNWPDVAGN